MPATLKNRGLRALVVDSDRISRELLVEALLDEGSVAIIGTHDNLDRLTPDALNQAQVVLLQTRSKHTTNCLMLLQKLAQAAPSVRSVVIFHGDDPKFSVEALKLGARGIISGCSTPSVSTITRSIRAVLGGEVWASSREIDQAIEMLATSHISIRDANGKELLSRRESEVVRLLVDGRNNREIAEALKLSKHTIKNYLFHIFDKLGVSNRIELALYASASRSRIRVTPEECS